MCWSICVSECVFVNVCVCVCKCACQVVQELFESKELVQEKRDGKTVYGMPTFTVTKGRKVSNTVKLEAFKKLDQKQISEYQDAFQNVFADVCQDMDIQNAIKEMPKSIQEQYPAIPFAIYDAIYDGCIAL